MTHELSDLLLCGYPWYHLRAYQRCASSHDVLRCGPLVPPPRSDAALHTAVGEDANARPSPSLTYPRELLFLRSLEDVAATPQQDLYPFGPCHREARIRYYTKPSEVASGHVH